MEWIDIYESSHGSNSLFSPPSQLPAAAAEPPQPVESEWTFEENKVFEKTMADFGVDTPAFYENVMLRLPDKSLDDIRKNFESLVNDVEMIESNQVPVPNYDRGNEKLPVVEDRNCEVLAPIPSPVPAPKPQAKQPRKTLSGNLRKRGIPWTEDEHQLFLMGLNKYGKGDWNSISRYYVVSKTSTQVASHAQKFYRRQNSTTPPDRRRPSIHDIQTVNVNMGSGTGDGSGFGSGYGPGSGSGSGSGSGLGAQPAYYNNGRQQMMMNNMPSSLSPIMNPFYYNSDDLASNGMNREMMMMMKMMGDNPNYSYSNLAGSTSNAAAAAGGHVDGSMRMMMNDPVYNHGGWGLGSGSGSGSNAGVDGGSMNYPYESSSCYN